MIVGCKPLRLNTALVFSVCLFSVLPLRAQDGVWTDVFNGKDLTGLKKSGSGTVTVNAAEKLIEVSGANGYLYTESEYTHYRARVEWKNIGGGNTGYLHHVDLSKVNCSWPAGPELQMYQGHAGEIWTTDCKFNSVGNNLQYNPAGGKLTGIGSFGCGARTNFRGTKAVEKTGDWNAWEIFVKGDSLEVKVNGAVVMSISKLTTTGDVPMIKGRMALQIEGSRVQWRNWQVMDLGTPTGIVPLSRNHDQVRILVKEAAPGFGFTREGLPGKNQVEVFSATGRKAVITIPAFD